MRIDYAEMAKGKKLCVHTPFEVSEGVRVVLDIMNSSELMTPYFECGNYQPRSPGIPVLISLADLGYELNMDGQTLGRPRSCITYQTMRLLSDRTTFSS